MHPDSIINIGNLKIYPYGVCMAVGILACFGFLMFTMWKKKFNEDATDKILIIGIVGTGFGIFSAMLFQATYNFIANPQNGFNLGESMTFIGGLIGGTLCFLGVYWLYIYVIAPAAKKRADSWEAEKAEGNGKNRSQFVVTANKLFQNNMNATLTDALPFIPIGIAIAHAFGRLGCFFGGCCYGKPDDIHGVACATGYSKLLGMYMNGVKVVPLQLYEMAFLLVLGAVMALLYFKFKLNYNFGVYAVAYGIWRFIIEFYRGDDRGSFLGTLLSPSQIWSIVMVIVGIGYFFLQYFVLSKHMKHPELPKSAEPAQTDGEKKTEVTE